MLLILLAQAMLTMDKHVAGCSQPMVRISFANWINIHAQTGLSCAPQQQIDSVLVSALLQLLQASASYMT